MKIGLISLTTPNRDGKRNKKKQRVYQSRKIEDERRTLISNIVNSHPDFDLIVFSGDTLGKIGLNDFLANNRNRHSTVILEFDSLWAFIKGKNIIKRDIKQLFSESSQAKPEIVEELVERLENERKVEVEKNICRLVICGENNMLMNRQSEGNKVYFRVPELYDRFERIYKNADVFLNPAHTPMGNLGKMRKRWSFLSRDARLCVFTTNALDSRGLHQDRLQYIFKNGKRQKAAIEIRDGYRMALFVWNKERRDV